MKWGVATLSVLAACAWSASARADDIELDADTTLQAYDVQSPATSVVWARRRLTQSLALHYVKPLAAREPNAPPPPSVGANVRLRLHRDFGDTCLIDDPLCFAVVNPARRGSYTPIANNGLLDLPTAYVEARELPHGLALRAGRQLHYDSAGLTRVDGMSVHLEPHALLSLHAVGGVLVRRDSVAGSDAFVPQGAPRIPLEERELRRAPYVEVERTSWLAGTGLELGDESVLRGSVAFRALVEGSQWVERRIGSALVSQPIDALRLSTHALFDTIDAGVIDADAGAQLWLAPYRVHAELERHVPRFDPGSVWAFFDAAPVWIAGAGASRQLTSAWNVELTLRGRRTQLSVAPEDDAGVELGTNLVTPRNTLSLSGFGWGGGSGPLWGGSLAAGHRITRAVTLDADFSAMRIDDPLRSAMRGVGFYEQLSARVEITDESALQLALSHAYSEPIGQRIAFMAFLHLGAWR